MKCRERVETEQAVPVIRLYYQPIPGTSDVYGWAVDQDGELITDSVSSNEDYLRADLGVGTERNQAPYLLRYPHGYRLEWVGKAEG